MLHFPKHYLPLVSILFLSLLLWGLGLPSGVRATTDTRPVAQSTIPATLPATIPATEESVICLPLVQRQARPITFQRAEIALPGLDSGAAAWGDYDHDGDLDILLAGDTGSTWDALIYRNDGATFAARDVLELPGGVSNESAVAWGDYDSDGDLDALLTMSMGLGDTAEPLTALNTNQGNGTFSYRVCSLEPVDKASLAWGDYDLDGALDVLIAGQGMYGPVSMVYRNTLAVPDRPPFTSAQAGLPGAADGAAVWGDYDGDGDLDILLTGQSDGGPIARVYRNDAGEFADIEAGLPGVAHSAAAWGDYDRDGDLDILLAGDTGAGLITRIYRNEGSGSFVDTGIALPGVRDAAVAWGDCDNDGRSDIVLSGDTGAGLITRVYRNMGGGRFSQVEAALPGVANGSVAWGDYDNDGALDILLCGRSATGSLMAIWRCIGAPANTPPTAPTNLTAAADETRVVFSWTAATDSQTRPDHLTYNLRVGTTPGACDVISSMALDNGRRLLPAPGNAGRGVQAWLLGLPAGHYYWSVQAVDGAYAGGPFAAEGTFMVPGFEAVQTNLPGIVGGDIAWGDYDRDGDLDVLLSGESDPPNGSREMITGVYRNNGGGNFGPIYTLGPSNGYYSALGWVDYDRDGDLDVFLWDTGDAAGIHRNNGDGTFTDMNIGLQGLYGGDVAWGDCDNDGDLDLLVTGRRTSDDPTVTRIYLNQAGMLTLLDTDLPGLFYSSVEWGDYDNDGDLDILLAGMPEYSECTLQVYRNEDGAFVQAADLFEAGEHLQGFATWGDYDADGDLDILFTGTPNTQTEDPAVRIYRNDNATFVDSGPILPGVYAGSARWGDYDNDGDLDIVAVGAVGKQDPRGEALLIRYNGRTPPDGDAFTLVSVELPGLIQGRVAWGDYDADGDLDLLLTGNATNPRSATYLYANYREHANTPPTAPTGLTAQVLGDSIALSWGAATDGETPTDGLTYNLRVGTMPGGCDTVSPMALAGGRRLLPQWGNVGHGLTATLTLPDLVPGRTYYWSVQAIDGAYSGGTPSAEAQFVIPDAPMGTVRIQGSTIANVDTTYTFTATVNSITVTCPITFVWEVAGRAPVVHSGKLEQRDAMTYAWGAPGPQTITVTASSAAGALQDTHTLSLRAVGFADIGAGLVEVGGGCADWGDYDNDGDLDVLVGGEDGYSGKYTRIYRNDGGTFADIQAGLPGIELSHAAWGDYDRDGDLDIVLIGPAQSAIYRNDGGAFHDIGAGLPGLSSGYVDWGDYDRDNDLDLVLCGWTGSEDITRVYRNDGGAFVNIWAGLPGLESGSACWGDYDRDGDLDLLLAGSGMTRIFYNAGGAFHQLDTTFPGVYNGAADWEDYDRDGDLDFVLTGRDNMSYLARIYRNNGNNTFTDIAAGLTGVHMSRVTWGDYNNDGFPDLLLSGWTGTTGSPSIAAVYRNNGDGTLTNIEAGLAEVMAAPTDWGDYDNDGDLDILLTGYLNYGRATRVYRNNLRGNEFSANTPPTAPGGLAVDVVGSSATLRWNAATDGQTPPGGLTYNVRVGTAPGGCNVLSPQNVPAAGNAGGNLQIPLRNLAPGTYFWSVQAVDTAYASSGFAPEGSFVIGG